MSDARFKLTYRPEGAKPIVEDIDILDGLKASEVIAVKKATGGAIAGVAEFLSGIMSSDMEAIKALVWIVLKRRMSTVSWDRLDFTLSEVQIDYVDDLTDEQVAAKLVAHEQSGTINELGAKRLAELREAGVVPAVVEEDPKA
ncbi:MAG TPA: hypothetical protein VIR15_13755 [Intrasporangium sp.]|uniref:hypothetical protein n=1 Tax=Intrasporangium sp. TaxID=1925024 RepID=UPI002F9393BF